MGERLIFITASAGGNLIVCRSRSGGARAIRCRVIGPRAIQARGERGPGRADRPLPGLRAGSGIDGVDVAAGNRARGALGESESECKG